MIVNCFVVSGSTSAGSQQNLVRQEFTLQNHGRRNVRYIRKVRRNQTDKSVRMYKYSHCKGLVTLNESNKDQRTSEIDQGINGKHLRKFSRSLSLGQNTA